MNAKTKIDMRAIMLDGASIQRAHRASWWKMLERHKKLGNSIVVWRDGKVVEIPAEDIQIPDEATDPKP